MTLEIVDLQEQHLPDAAALAVARYRALRHQVPDLPSRYEDMDVLLPMLRDLHGQAPGVAALQGGQLVGYMACWALNDFRGQRAVFSPEWGNGADPAQSRRAYDEMYTRVSAAWVAEGAPPTCFANSPTTAPPWRAGSGWALDDRRRRLARSQPCTGPAAEIDIRRAGPQDTDLVLALAAALNRHLARRPPSCPTRITHAVRMKPGWPTQHMPCGWPRTPPGCWLYEAGPGLSRRVHDYPR